MTLAVIMEMRKHVWLLVVIIGVAIVSFLLMDAINSNLGLFGNEQGNFVGEVEGENITYDRFNQEYNDVEKRLTYFQGYWMDPEFDWTETQRFQIRDLAWDKVKEDVILGNEYRDLGLTVTEQEIDNLIFTPNPDPQVRNFYQQVVNNQPNAPYDPAQMQAAVQQIMALTPQEQGYVVKDYYLQLRDYLREEVLKSKYLDLISKSLYVPKWKAQQEYTMRSNTAFIEYAFMPYASVADTEVQPTDEELKAYLKKNENKYKPEETRAIEYAIFNITPTESDSLNVLQWISDRMEKFRTTKNDSIFIRQYSERPFQPIYLGESDFEGEVSDTFFTADTGSYIGPYLENGKYKVAKIIDRQIMPDSVQVSHVLASLQRYQSIDSARMVIDSAQAMLQAGAPFDSVAIKYSDDQASAVQGGDLGWITTKDMLFKEFYNSIFMEYDQGEVFTVETPVGVHLVRIDSATIRSPKVKLAVLEKTIVPGTATRDSLYSVATQFYTEPNIATGFDSILAKMNKSPQKATLKGDEIIIPGIAVPGREIVKWAFEAEQGDVKLFQEYATKDNKYVVARLVRKSEKGSASIENYREELTQAVIKEKKAERLKEKMKGASDINALASKEGVTTGTASGISYTSQFIEGLGVEPEVVSTALALSQGKISQPIAGNNGVYVIKVTQKNEAPAPEDVSMFKNQVIQNLQGRFGGNVLQEMKEAAEVNDNRYKFY